MSQDREPWVPRLGLNKTGPSGPSGPSGESAGYQHLDFLPR